MQRRDRQRLDFHDRACKASSSAWTAVTGTEITGLAAGNYEVRFKQTDNYNASPSVSITIPDGGVATYTLTVVGGTGGGIIAEGASVTITADEITGKRFVRWTSEDGVVFANATSAETTFDMPAKDVTVRAEFENIEYTVTVKGGLCNIGEIEQESTMKVAYGQNVNLHAGKPVGKRFVKWTCKVCQVDLR